MFVGFEYVDVWIGFEVDDYIGMCDYFLCDVVMQVQCYCYGCIGCDVVDVFEQCVFVIFGVFGYYGVMQVQQDGIVVIFNGVYDGVVYQCVGIGCYCCVWVGLGGQGCDDFGIGLFGQFQEGFYGGMCFFLVVIGIGILLWGEGFKGCGNW